MHARAFSLIELVIVVVIIAIIGAIAIPRMSRGAAGAADSKLIADLATMRKAIDLFTTEHGGQYPKLTMIVADLTLYSDDAGTSAQTNADSTHIYGPYLRAIPALSIGVNKNHISIGGPSVDPSSATGIGWIYDETVGTIKANASDSEVDASGKAYNKY
jgi:prepilin-type N-terminal cleavage/methylation domain-containing protein